MLDQLTRSEIMKVSKDSIVILPLGATEQHGDHLNISVDNFIVSELAKRCCLSVRDYFPAFVAPVLPYGNSHHHRPYPTLSLSSETLLAVIKDLLRSLVLIGFENIVILNSHGGNDEAIRMATRDIAKEQSVKIASSSYWTIAWDALLEANATKLGKVPGHAGGFETSLILALDERQVKLDKRPRKGENIPKNEIRNTMFIQTPKNSVGFDG